MGRWTWKLINDFGFRYKFLCKPCDRCQNSHKLENLQHPYSVFPLIRIEQHLNRYSCYSTYTGMMMTCTIVTPLKAVVPYWFKVKDISIMLLVCVVVIQVWTMGWLLCSYTHPCLLTECSSGVSPLVSLAAIQTQTVWWRASLKCQKSCSCHFSVLPLRGLCLPVCEADAVPTLYGGCTESHQVVWQLIAQNKQRCEMASFQKTGLCRWRIWDVN